jgi:hypothetical protein
MKQKMPGPAAMIGLMLLALVATWLEIWGPIDFSPAIATIVLASIGIVAAVYNVSRQIRINILVREEDRIEKQLPGLRNAVNFLEPFTELGAVDAFYAITPEFGRRGFGTGSGSTPEKDVEKALPATDDATRSTVLDVLLKAFGSATAAQGSRGLIDQLERNIGDPASWAAGELRKARDEIEGAGRLFEQQRATFRTSMDRLKAEIALINDRIARYERRRRRIRAEIERYFGD